MAQRGITFLKGLEDPKYPLLGPNIRGLYLFGLWLYGSKLRTYCFYIIHSFSIMFVFTMTVQLYLYIKRNDYAKMLENISITALSIVAISKISYVVTHMGKWRELVENISEEERNVIKSRDPEILQITKDYTMYARLVTYFFWGIVLFTNAVTLVTPFITCLTPDYVEKLNNGTEVLPHILNSWFPFDDSKGYGYIASVIIHAYMTTQGAGIIASYDAHAMVIMTFFKGQMMILGSKCRRLFVIDDLITSEGIYSRIKECHRLHNYLMTQFKLFDSLLSPVMFVYMLVCSITICCSVIQLNLPNTSLSQKLWAIEYAAAQIFQLFLYCWHSNDILMESLAVDRCVFNNDWWAADTRIRRHLVMLAAKLNNVFQLKAGPFTRLSMPTFIDIMKGSYSFYTLFAQIPENK